ncbi:MAG: DJ-1/PfpI family protein [Puniceicoccaceae bacterium]|nr:MAG: DJ-1/PfpI family protein [Puniceicoccaceae bacterium]
MEDPTVLVVLGEGFEEVEALTPVDLLRRAGAVVTLASTGDHLAVTGRNQITVHADVMLEEIQSRDFDLVVIPGGPGVKALRRDPRVLDLLRAQAGREAWIGSICAGPTVLHEAGLLEGRRYTGHPSIAAELPNLEPIPVVESGRIVTSRGAGTALDFSLALVERLFDAAKANEIAASICLAERPHSR